MALWSPMDIRTSETLRSHQDGNWNFLAVWLGNPPQLLYALVSTSGTTLEVPIDPECTGDGSDKRTVVPHYSRHDWHSPRHGVSDIPENGQTGLVKYTPYVSRAWQSVSGCSKGSDVLRGVLWRRIPGLDDVWNAMDEIRVPLEETSGIATIGLRAIATNWHGKQDYWWALMTKPMISLFQTLPILSYGIAQQQAAFMYSYRLGRPYRKEYYAWLRIGQIDYYRDDVNARRVRRPISEDGSLMLDSFTLDLIINNSSRSTNTSTSLISKPMHASLDSALPFLELPREVCFRIAEDLDLQYDEQTDIFYMDNDLLSRLESIRPSLRFGLGFQPIESTPFGDNAGPVEVELPFEALNHIHEPASVGEHRRKPFFPIRIADESRGIVLGRTLFQEIELTVDYDKNEFTVYPLDGWIASIPNFDHGPSDGWPPWLSLLLPRLLLVLVLLSGILFLPSLKMAYNLQKHRQRRYQLERSWVQSHTLSIASEELSRYVNAVIRKSRQGGDHPRGRTPGASWIFALMTGSFQSIQIAFSWLARRWEPRGNVIQLSQLDEMDENNNQWRQTARKRRNTAIRRQQENLRIAWGRGKSAGAWLYQHLLTPAFQYSIVKPLEWTIKLAAASANTSRRLALRRQREGEIRLD